jgi:hypothetical protein
LVRQAFERSLFTDRTIDALRRLRKSLDLSRCLQQIGSKLPEVSAAQPPSSLTTCVEVSPDRLLSGNSDLLRRNAFLGNLHDGIRLIALDVTITENNIFGNTCGLRNGSGAVTDASKNFWGDALGPGSDPADQICDQPGSVTVWQPAATVMFQINIQ